METKMQELLSPYLNDKALQKALKAGDLDTAETLTAAAVEKIRKAQKDDEDKCRLLYLLLEYLKNEVFLEALQPHGLDISNRPEAMQAMQEGFAAFLAGEEQNDAEWLYDLRGEQPVPAHDKKPLFFRMMQALQLTAADLNDQPPVGVPVPKMQQKEYGNCILCTILDADITEDGGLRKDMNPLGKDFILRDADGCIYHLNGLVRAEMPGKLSAGSRRNYAATGWIEGYTTDEPRDIMFEIMRGGQYVFSFLGTEDDGRDARWDAYYDWAEGYAQAALERVRKLLGNL